VAEDVREVTRPQTVTLLLGLVVIFAVALVAGIGDGGDSALEDSAIEKRAVEAGEPKPAAEQQGPVIKNWTQVIANLLTSLALVGAAIASARLRLFAGRPEFTIEKRAVGARTGESEAAVGKSILIAVRVKNTGRAQLTKQDCFITLVPLTAPEIERTGVLVTGRYGRERSDMRNAWGYSLFEDLLSLEPDEGVEDGLLVAVTGEFNLLKVSVDFVGRPGWTRSMRKWGASQILDLYEVRPSGDGD
jgi:hypothetical protein